MTTARALYAWLLRAYPPAFRAEFAEEMQAVFALAAHERGGPMTLARELRDWPASVARAWLNLEVDMNQNETAPASRIEAFLGVLPFLAFGAVVMLGKIPGTPYTLFLHYGVWLMALIGFVGGWAKGFPRWTMAHLGWALVYSWWMAAMPLNNLVGRVGGSRELLGARALLPLAVAALAALLLMRSLRPLQQWLAALWHDWTQLSLGMYALFTFAFLLYDENHHPYVLAFMLMGTAALAGGGWAYLRARSLVGRVLALLGGAVIAVAASMICDATWDWHAYYNLPAEPDTRTPLQIALIIGLWGAILYWPALVGLARWLTTPRKATAA